jgi:tetratricopeptide (TPR) repeat protein
VIGLALIAQIAIVARGPDTATSCAPLELSVAARAQGAVAPRIMLPLAGDLQLLRSRLVSRTDHDGAGQASTITEGVFVVATRSVGRVVLPAFVASVGAASVRSTPLTVEVSPTEVSTPTVLVRASLEGGSAAHGDSLYVGQQVDYVVDVHLNEAARQRLRRNPTFFSPDMPAVLAYDLPAAPPVERETRRCFETLSYRRALFPLFPGPGVIPPAVLTYSLPLSTSFFSREESYEVRTEGVHFVALEPPLNGRPSDYAGAVGAVHASASVSTSQGRMGDPVVLTVRLEGTGNVKLLPRPVISLAWASIALGEERVTVDTSVAAVRGTKEFDWLLTPERAGHLVVPGVRYPFFDPARGAYDVALTDSAVLDVTTASLASADTSLATRLPIRTVLRAEVPPELPARGWYWLLLVLAPAPATLRRLRTGRRRRASGVSAARRLRKLGLARTPPAPRELRRAFLDAMRDRVPALRDSTSRLPLGRALRYAGVTEATALEADEVLERLDAAAFSPVGQVDRALVQRAVAIAAAVDNEAVRPAPTRAGGGPATALVLALLVGAPLAGMPDAVTRTFADGVAAYERGEFAAAQRLFARTSARAPRAVDAWANLGAAAWTRGDTAHAALGWQRALRLDPLDAEVRDRLATVQPPLIGSAAYVAPVPVNAMALGALVLWLSAWLALALPLSWRPPQTRAVAGGALVLAVVALGGALELRDRADVRGLGVLRSGRELLDAPTPAAPPAATAAAGEVGAMGAREGAWVRLTLDGSRAGWLPVAALIPLDGAGGD